MSSSPQPLSRCATTRVVPTSAVAVKVAEPSEALVMVKLVGLATGVAGGGAGVGSGV